MNELIRQIPSQSVLLIGKHFNGSGYFAGVYKGWDFDTLNWAQTGHGNTPEEATEEALAIFNGEQEFSIHLPGEYEI